MTLEIGGDGVLISLDMVLALKVKQSWPGSTINGLKIEEWLGTKVRTDFRRKSFYLVPKQQPLETTEGAQALSKKGALSLPFKEQMHEQNMKAYMPHSLEKILQTCITKEPIDVTNDINLICDNGVYPILFFHRLHIIQDG